MEKWLVVVYSYTENLLGISKEQITDTFSYKDESQNLGV